MKSASLFLLCLMVFCSLRSYAQSKKVPTKPIAFENRLPVYKDGKMSLLHKDLDEAIMPIVDRYVTEHKNQSPPSKLRISLFIDEKGKVYDVGFPLLNLPNAEREQVKARLLTMEGWKAPVIKGKPIKSVWVYNVNCLLWQ